MCVCMFLVVWIGMHALCIYICVCVYGVHAYVSVYKHVCVYMCMYVYGVCTYVSTFLYVLIFTQSLLRL